MDVILLLLSLVCALFGGWLLVDFMLWRGMGRVETASIIGFGDEKSKGMKIPEVSFETEEGQEVRALVRRIDQFLFLLNRPGQGDFTTVIYEVRAPEKVRIYGYIHVVAGAFLFAPSLVYLAMRLESSALLGQVFYMLIFGGIVFGGWVGLKLIQKYY